MKQRELTKRRTAGAVTLELIIALPALIICILAIVETGILMANLQTVAAASRDGARMAARTPSLHPGTPSAVRAAVNRRLEAAGFGRNACAGVAIQHNLGGRAECYTSGACSPPSNPPLPSRCVRVRVSVPYERLAPNLLRTFGLTLVGKVAEKDATFAHEF